MAFVIAADADNLARYAGNQQLHVGNLVANTGGAVPEKVALQFGDLISLQSPVRGTGVQNISYDFCHLFLVIHFTQRVGGKMNAAMSRITKAKTSSRTINAMEASILAESGVTRCLGRPSKKTDLGVKEVS